MLHQTARQGILNLIPKPGKDSRRIKKLRPINLLNTDYKIIEKAVANKMIPSLKHIIHSDQRGFMKDRRISVNIRKLLDTIEYAKEHELEALILSLIKEWTKVIYNQFQVRVQNNGTFSKPIDIQKGVHQGGCCSSVYFLVIPEILTISLRNNENIEGIDMGFYKQLLNQFADDMDIASMA